MTVQEILNNVGGDNQEILAQLLSYRNGYTSGNKPKQTIEAVCQESGARFTATIFTGTGLRMDDRNLNEVLMFNLSAANIGGKVRITGFWQSHYVGGQQGAATPSPAMNRQAPPQPIAPPALQKDIEAEKWAKKDKQIHRDSSIKNATLAITTLATLLDEAAKINTTNIIAMAECFVQYIYTGGIGEDAQQGEGFQRQQNEPDAPEPDEWDNYIAGGEMPK